MEGLADICVVGISSFRLFVRRHGPVTRWRSDFPCPAMGTPKIYTATGLGLRKNGEMARVDHLVVYMQTGVKFSSLYIHHPGGGARPRGGVNTNCCILSILHIQHQTVHTNHIPIFSRPKPGGGVYLWGPRKGKIAGQRQGSGFRF